MPIARYNTGNTWKLLTNFSFLALTQVSNLVLPALVMPYLIRTIGIDRFGVVILAQTTMTYLYIITEYGFGITATQHASLCRNDITALTNLFNHVTTTRLLLTGISFFILILLTGLINQFNSESLVFYLSFGMVIGKMLLPLWFFQGIEQMKYTAYFNFIAKIILVCLMLIIVKRPEDYKIVNLIWAIGDILVGVISLWFINYRFAITLKLSSLKNVFQQLKEGWPIFVTNITNNIYISSGVLVLGFFSTASVVGMYAIAEKIMFLAKQIAGMMLQASYPHACKLAAESWLAFKNFLKLEMLFYSLFFLTISLSLFFFAESITILYAGHAVNESIKWLKLLSIVPLTVGLTIPPYQVMVIYKFNRAYMSIIITGVIINLVLNTLLVANWGAWGTVYTVVFTELFIVLAFHLVLRIKYSSYRLTYF